MCERSISRTLSVTFICFYVISADVPNIVTGTVSVVVQFPWYVNQSLFSVQHPGYFIIILAFYKKGSFLSSIDRLESNNYEYWKRNHDFPTIHPHSVHKNVEIPKCDDLLTSVNTRSSANAMRSDVIVTGSNDVR